ALHAALLGGEVALLYARLGEAARAAGRPLLVRLMVDDGVLQGVPWEALGGWAGAAGTLAGRGRTNRQPRHPRPGPRAVRVLGVAPSEGAGLATLKGALAARIDAGEVAWLDPMEGAMARRNHVLGRLGRAPIPHVLHFIGHGKVEEGKAALQVADEE